MFGFFTKFFGSNEFIFRGAERAGSRLMLHISTQDGYGTREVVTPRGISRGDGDRYLVNLNRRIAEHGEPTYIRLMAEMNQANNGYAAFDKSGRSRGPAHSTAAFKQAWRRSTLILRGGPVAEIDAALHRLGLPPVKTRRRGAAAAADRDGVGPADPRDAGHPGQHAAARTGPATATWTGSGPTSTAASRTSSGSTHFYRDFGGKPFVFGEWALWGADDPGFVTPAVRLDRQPSARADGRSTTRAR